MISEINSPDNFTCVSADNLIDSNSLYKIQYGVYIITTKHNEKLNGQIATTVFQVTCDPIKIAVCLSKNTYTHELINLSKVMGISILEQATPLAFIGKLGFRCGRNCDKFTDIEYEFGALQCPLVLTHGVAVLEAAVQQSLDVGTHTIFIGEVKRARKINDCPALTYEYYHTVIKGKSPENAPTYQGKNN